MSLEEVASPFTNSSTSSSSYSSSSVSLFEVFFFHTSRVVTSTTSSTTSAAATADVMSFYSSARNSNGIPAVPKMDTFFDQRHLSTRWQPIDCLSTSIEFIRPWKSNSLWTRPTLDWFNDVSQAPINRFGILFLLSWVCYWVGMLTPGRHGNRWVIYNRIQVSGSWGWGSGSAPWPPLVSLRMFEDSRWVDGSFQLRLVEIGADGLCFFPWGFQSMSWLTVSLGLINQPVASCFVFFNWSVKRWLIHSMLIWLGWNC